MQSVPQDIQLNMNIGFGRQK